MDPRFRTSNSAMEHPYVLFHFCTLLLSQPVCTIRTNLWLAHYPCKANIGRTDLTSAPYRRNRNVLFVLIWFRSQESEGWGLFYTPRAHTGPFSLLKNDYRGMSPEMKAPSVKLATLPLPSALAMYTWTLASTCGQWRPYEIIYDEYGSQWYLGMYGAYVFPAFVLQLRKNPGKTSTRKTDPTGDRNGAR